VNPARLASLATHGVALDIETHAIQPGLLTPPVVVGAMATIAGAELREKNLTVEDFLRVLRSTDGILIGANIAYDLACVVVEFERSGLDILPDVYRAFEEERVFDIQIAEQLHAVGRGWLGKDPETRKRLRDPVSNKIGWYNLNLCVYWVLGRIDAKDNDEYRKRYHELDGIPIEQWPESTRAYPVDDVCNTLEVALAQAGFLPSRDPHQWTSAGGLRCARCGATQPGSPCTVVEPRMNLHDLANQTYSAFALHLGAVWGFHVDGEAVDALERSTWVEDPETGERTARGDMLEVFQRAGIMRADGSQDTAVVKQMVARAYGACALCTTCAGTGRVPSPKGGKSKVQCAACSATGYDLSSAPIPRADKGGVSKSRDTLMESGDELLMDLGRFGADSKTGQTYVPYLKLGFRILDGIRYSVPLNLQPNVLLETGRTSYRGVIQLFPRKGGARECIVARPGYYLGSCDYEAGELVTGAQNCLWTVGKSELAKALNAGIKPHNAFAATLAGIGYEDYNKRLKLEKYLDDLRQASKAANFGYPGRMGAWKLVLQQRASGPNTVTKEGRVYKGLRFCIAVDGALECGRTKVTEYKGRTGPPTCRHCIDVAERLRKRWLQQWPEYTDYFEFVKQQDALGYVVHHVSKRIRGGLSGQGNAIANGYFQGLLADAAKAALRQLSRECYDRTFRVPHGAPHAWGKASAYAGGSSPLHGSRVILFAHDEVIPEYPISVAHDAATRTSEVMVEKLQLYCPDLAPAVRAPPALMRRWFKGADPVFENGTLVPWEPS
jgi:hypothetical protein